MMKTYILLLPLLLLTACVEDNSLPGSAQNPIITTYNTTLENDQAAILYESCQPCHGARAEKSALGKSAVIANFTKQNIIDAINGYKNGTRDRYGMGALMTGQVADLTTKETEILADYISSF